MTTFSVEVTPAQFGQQLDALASVVTPQQFAISSGLSPLGLGVQDDSPAFVAALAYLHAFALNAGGGGFYKGSPKLFIPAGHYYLGTTTLDITHSIVIEGEGDGWLGPAAFGCTHLRWAAATDGIRVQSPNTSGNTTVDVGTHDGAGGVFLRDLMLEGGYAATESEHHGLVVRNAVKASNLYIKNFPGEGVKAWAGNVSGFGNVGGNVSTSLFIGVKVEGCRGAFDIRGADANVCTFINCEGYQNRQFGYLDDNGAGSNTVIGMHCASNGLISGTAWPQTQCSYSGRRKALKWGGDPTVAPSTDTTDTINWLDIEAGAAITNLIPAWVNTPGTFRAGGDYLTINSASVHFDNCYSEGGGFSQFTTGTIITHGTIGKQYSRGGWRWIPQSDGLAFKTGPAGGNLILENDAEIGLFAQDSAGIAYGSLDFVKSGGAYLNSHTGHNFRIDGVTVSSIDPSGHYFVGVNQVIGARRTGWTAATGTPARGAFAAAAAGTASVGYVQAEAQGALTRIAALEARFIAWEADARVHGLIDG